MPAIRYTFSAADILSDELRAALRRRMHEIIGVALLGVAGIAAIALATWSVQDPSLSHATNAPVRNMLGLPGAISADLMMQLLGIATIALLFPVAAWGWRLLTHRPLDRERVARGAVDRRRVRGRGFCLMPAAEQGVAAADRPRRRDRRRAAARARLGVRRTAVRRAALHHRDRDRHRGVRDARARGRLRLARRRAEEEVERSRSAREAAKPPPRRTCEARRTRMRKTPSRAASSRSAGSITSSTASRRASRCCRDAADRSMLPWRRRPRVVPLRHDPSAVTLVEPHAEPYSNPGRRSGRGESRSRGGGEAEVDGRAAQEASSPAARPAKQRKDGYELPSLALLAAPKPGDRRDALRRGDPGKCARARKRAQRFRRARRDHQRASGPGGHALRARARARHQVLARDRPVRRHRALDEQGLGARRRRARAATRSASSCRTRSARRSCCANCSRRANTPTRRRSCRSASARPSAASR